jgi:hypothetical protein
LPGFFSCRTQVAEIVWPESPETTHSITNTMTSSGVTVLESHYGWENWGEAQKLAPDITATPEQG